MRRLGKPSVTALTMSVGLAGALFGAGAADGDRGKDSVQGAAVNGFPTPAGPGSARVVVRASSGPGGERPTGLVEANGDADGTDATSFSVRGEVTCLRVSGRRAAIKYRFRRAEGTAAAFKGGGVQIFVETPRRPSVTTPTHARTTRWTRATTPSAIARSSRRSAPAERRSMLS
jgi:hypothetical protein